MSSNGPGAAGKPRPIVTAPPVGHFGTALRRARLARFWTEITLGAEADLSAGYISRLERGDRKPTRRAVERLAVALSLPEMERQALLLAAGYAPSIEYMRHLARRESS